MATKPATLTPWATTLAAYPNSGLNNRVQPPVGWQTDGWDENEEPAPNYENYRAWEAYTWRVWFGAALARGATKVVRSADSTDHHADYICDGVNDQVEIQAAIDAVAAMGTGGGMVLLSQGTFAINAALILDTDVCIRGMGPGTVLQVEATTAIDFNILRATAKVRVRVENLLIDGNSAVAHGHFHTGVKLDNCSDAHVSNIVVINCDQSAVPTFGYGVHIAGGSLRTRISQCEFTLVKGAGVYEEAAASMSLVANNILGLPGGGGGGWGGIIMNGARPLIVGNAVHSSFALGIGVTADFASILNNVIHDSGAHGIQAIGGSFCQIQGNRIYNSTRDGIQIGNDDSIVSGNLINAAGSQGIYVGAAERTIIHENQIRATQTDGIYLDTCKSVSVKNNSIVDVSQALTNTSSGVYINGGAGCTVTGNRFRNSGATVSKASIEGVAGGSGAPAVYGNDCRAGSGTAEILDGAGDFVSVPVFAWDGAVHQTNTAAMDLVNII